MKIKRFNESVQSVNENVTLYRLVSVPKGEPLVVDTESPGKFYFNNETGIDPSLLKNDGGDLHVIKITTPSDNIDSEASKSESDANGKQIGNAIVVLSDPTLAEVESITPYKKVA